MQRLISHLVLLLAASFSTVLAATPGAANDADLNCVILPDEQVELSSPVPGVIEAVLVNRSDRVSRGQVLARLESSVEEATVALAGARETTNAEAGLRRVELDYDAQHRDRLQALHTRQAVSAQIREDAERVAAVARLRLRLADDRRREAMLERHRADAILALKTLKSPIDGVIVERLRTVGEYVEDRPILRIARLDPLRVEVIAPLALFGTVHRGMQIAVRPETDPEHERVATVTAVDAVADPGSGTFGVQLELPNPNLVLPAGIKCKGRLLTRMAGDVVEPMPAPPEPPVEPASAHSDDGERLEGPVRTSKFVSHSAVETTLEPAPELNIAVANAPTFVVQDVRTTHAAIGGDACLTFKAVDNESTARALARAAERLGARAKIRDVSARRVVGYVVVSAAQFQSASQRAFETRLRAAGITDFAVMGRGDYAGRISLGVYKGPISAERRRAALAELGFEVEVQPRTRERRTWQVALQLDPPLDVDSVRATLAGNGATDVAESAVCEPLLTAVR